MKNRNGISKGCEATTKAVAYTQREYQKEKKEREKER